MATIRHAVDLDDWLDDLRREPDPDARLDGLLEAEAHYRAHLRVVRSSINETICELADEGATPKGIAHRLGLRVSVIYKHRQAARSRRAAVEAAIARYQADPRPLPLRRGWPDDGAA